MLQDIVRFWKETWIKSKTLFICEAIGTFAALWATWMLAIYNSEYLMTVFTTYIVGNILYLFASYKRENAWLFVMTLGFMSFNVVGLIRLI